MVAIKDAFAAAQRQIEDAAKRLKYTPDPADLVGAPRPSIEIATPAASSLPVNAALVNCAP
jgi:hypothetical protein